MSRITTTNGRRKVVTPRKITRNGEASNAEKPVIQWVVNGIHNGSEAVPASRLYSPLRALTLQRVVNLLELSDAGYWADLQWLWRFVEKREWMTGTILDKRQSALERLDWTITPEKEASTDEASKAEAKLQTDFLRSVFGRIDNLREAWTFLGTATFRAFAHLEMHLDERGRVKHLEPVPQWFFGMDPSGVWRYDPQARSGYFGDPIDDLWVTRTVQRPVNEVASILFCLKSTSLRDWGLYAARHGVPNIFLEVDKDAGATSADFATMRGILERYVSGGRGVLPPGVSANLFGAGGSSDQTPFPGLMAYLDTALVTRGTGGKLTTLSEATGIGSGATPAHEQAFADLATAEANQIAGILQRAIGEPLLNKAFPGRAHLARFAIIDPAGDDKKQVAELLRSIKDAGFKVSDALASEMLGLPVERDLLALQDAGLDAFNRGGGVPVTVNAESASGVNGDAAGPEAPGADVAGRLAGQFGPTVDRLAELLNGEELTDAEREEVQALLADFPGVLEKLNAGGVGIDELETLLAEAFAEGLADAEADGDDPSE